ncbi:hypothetical protein ACFZB4_42905, partial [Streptomyces pseudovenezuelae]|uniref:hypothetical protein n=1 Tax=Streptomyces pseudovenezuelae TaxID=67350 RepID=UPI0036E5F234
MPQQILGVVGEGIGIGTQGGREIRVGLVDLGPQLKQSVGSGSNERRLLVLGDGLADSTSSQRMHTHSARLGALVTGKQRVTVQEAQHWMGLDRVLRGEAIVGSVMGRGTWSWIVPDGLWEIA